MQEIMQFISNHPILSLMWVIVFIGVSFTILQSHFSKIGEITCSEAIYLINKESAIIVDVRNRDDYCKGHIVNSVNLMSADIKSGNFGVLEKVKGQPVIVVCVNSIGSHKLAQNLIKAGFKRVYVLKKGISGWYRDNLPLVQGKSSSSK